MNKSLNLLKKAIPWRILVVVVKWRHRANGLFLNLLNLLFLQLEGIFIIIIIIIIIIINIIIIIIIIIMRDNVKHSYSILRDKFVTCLGVPEC